jgi:general stress protein YciG
MAKKYNLSKYMALAGKRGGKARLKTMTPEERIAIARKAGKASGKARAAKKAAKARKR